MNRFNDELTFSKPICNTCKYYNFNATCKAFPNGIPKVIIDGGSHDEPLPHQGNDIIYEESVE